VDGRVGTLEVSAESIKSQVKGLDGKVGTLEVTAESIASRVDATAEVDYTGIGRGTMSDGKRYVNIEDITKPFSVTSLDSIFTVGNVLKVTFEDANTWKGAARLNITDTGTDKFNDFDGYSIYKDGEIVSSTNPLLWNAGDTLLFCYSETTENHWDYINDSAYSELLVRLEGITGTSINRSGTGY
jgi:hypothetical protein